MSLTFEPQTIYGLLGRNGAGKSTLMSILNNRIIPNDNPETNVTLDGEQLLENDKQLSRLFLMSEVNLYPNNMRVKTIFKWTERFLVTLIGT
ncbi:ATP-binding cassette domain-containing protein [Holzapfeliella floricola]|uniref:ATP-binding cassette domain-containing protein n=1 Tax=Holzapfeliella floricola TaxID=679249 RepID=UPI00078611C5|nr:ATP-binding cassette domain-containing protein [Holzapfeliella floricola]